MTVESHWDRRALSWCGAIGLGQLMPETARRLRVDPNDAKDNLRGTTMYLHQLLTLFHEGDHPRLAIAGYNAGEEAVKRFGGIPPYAETQNYVRKVLATWKDVRTRFVALARTLRRSPVPDIAQPDARLEMLGDDGAEQFWVESDASAAGEDVNVEPTDTAPSEVVWNDAAMLRRVRSIIGSRSIVELDFDANARALVDEYLSGHPSRETIERAQRQP